MLNISISGVVFTVINLLVLYVLLKKFLFKPVTAMIEGRQKAIGDSLADAAGQKEQAGALKSEYENRLDEARREAAGIVDEARARGQREYETLLGQAQADAERVRADARRQMEAEREELLRGARREVAALALLCAAKVTGQEMDEAADRALADSFLAQAEAWK